jgi:hypothetical protein
MLEYPASPSRYTNTRSNPVSITCIWKNNQSTRRPHVETGMGRLFFEENGALRPQHREMSSRLCCFNSVQERLAARARQTN